MTLEELDILEAKLRLGANFTSAWKGSGDLYYCLDGVLFGRQKPNSSNLTWNDGTATPIWDGYNTSWDLLDILTRKRKQLLNK